MPAIPPIEIKLELVYGVRWVGHVEIGGMIRRKVDISASILAEAQEAIAQAVDPYMPAKPEEKPAEKVAPPPIPPPRPEPTYMPPQHGRARRVTGEGPAALAKYARDRD